MKLSLMPREEFANLSLHAKNAYLQGVAQQVAHLRGEPFIALDKEALSRIRRFYRRRSFADLRLEEMTEGPLIASLARLAEAIRAQEVTKVIQHATPRQSKSLVRPPPLDESQMTFFVPAIHDAPIKDDYNLMDIAPFALSKTTGEGVIQYELKDSLITVEGGAKVGLATAYDYDIVINMISHLAEATRQYRVEESKGLRTSLPPRTYRPAASDILRFCRRDGGGEQYLGLERALARLAATRITITSLAGEGKGKRREAESFPLIGRFKVVSRTAADRVDQIEIDVPNWVYEGVVKPDGKPSILTLNPDYFLITRPIAKFLYRLARKAAGISSAKYGMMELHRRSGSRLPHHKFKQAIREIVEAAVPLPDYDLSIVDGDREPLLIMANRAKNA